MVKNCDGDDDLGWLPTENDVELWDIVRKDCAKWYFYIYEIFLFHNQEKKWRKTKIQNPVFNVSKLPTYRQITQRSVGQNDTSTIKLFMHAFYHLL